MSAIEYRNGYYSSYSRSYRADMAEGEGKLPLTRLAKELGYPTKALKNVFTPCEWHHVGKYANPVDYYDTNEIARLLLEDDDTFIQMYRELGPRKRREYLKEVAAYRIERIIDYDERGNKPASHFERQHRAISKRDAYLRSHYPAMNLGTLDKQRLEWQSFLNYVSQQQKAIREKLDRYESRLKAGMRLGTPKPFTTGNQIERAVESVNNLRSQLGLELVTREEYGL